MNWYVQVDGPARRVIKKLRGKDSILVDKAIDSIAIDPFSGDIEKLGGQNNVWRRRAGSYRIFYRIYTNNKLVYILDVERRTSKTY